ncbi:MAG: hypothetical protein ACTHOP_12195, partial [Mesorhizobium sp.]
ASARSRSICSGLALLSFGIALFSLWSAGVGNKWLARLAVPSPHRNRPRGEPSSSRRTGRPVSGVTPRMPLHRLDNPATCTIRRSFS